MRVHLEPRDCDASASVAASQWSILLHRQRVHRFTGWSEPGRRGQLLHDDDFHDFRCDTLRDATGVPAPTKRSEQGAAAVQRWPQRRITPTGRQLMRSRRKVR